MPVWRYPDGTRAVVSQEQYDRNEEQQAEAFEAKKEEIRAREMASWEKEFGPEYRAKHPFKLSEIVLHAMACKEMGIL